MKIVVRIVDTAPCRNENTSSITALDANLSGPPKRATSPLVSTASINPANFGDRYIAKNVT